MRFAAGSAMPLSVGAQRTMIRVTIPGGAMTVSFQPRSCVAAGIGTDFRNGTTSVFPPTTGAETSAPSTV